MHRTALSFLISAATRNSASVRRTGRYSYNIVWRQLLRSEALLFAISQPIIRYRISTHIIGRIRYQSVQCNTLAASNVITSDVVTINVRIRFRTPAHASGENMVALANGNGASYHSAHGSDFSWFRRGNKGRMRVRKDETCLHIASRIVQVALARH